MLWFYKMMTAAASVASRTMFLAISAPRFVSLTLMQIPNSHLHRGRVNCQLTLEGLTSAPHWDGRER